MHKEAGRKKRLINFIVDIITIGIPDSSSFAIISGAHLQRVPM